MRAPATAAVLLAVAACGADERRAAPPAAAVTPPTAAAQPAGDADPVVATVDGQPVYGSCVTMQAAALGLDARAALDQCIAFELLAQEADRRGLRGDPDVVEAWRREMVRGVIAADLGDYHSLDDLPAGFRDAMLAKYRDYLHRPYLRGAHYARVPVARGALPGGPEELAAKAVADAIYEELKDAEGILPDELFAVADRHAAAAGLSIGRTHKLYFTPLADVAGIRDAVPEFRDSLAAIPEPGRIGRPARTPSGWDVPLYWTDLPEQDLTPEFFEDARRKYFVQWAEGLRARLGLAVSVSGDELAALAEEDGGEPAAPDEELPP
jgi:hypothetical protein